MSLAYQVAEVMGRLLDNNIDVTENFAVRDAQIAIKAGDYYAVKGRQGFIVLRITADFNEVTDSRDKHDGRFFSRTSDDVTAGYRLAAAFLFVLIINAV